MKKKVFALLILVFLASLIFSSFHISGWRIKNANKISNECLVSVIVHDENTNTETEYTLNNEQKNLLRNLLVDNSYTRRFKSTILGVLPAKRYTILADWNDNGKTNLYIKVLGNEYIQFSKQFGTEYLKINYVDFEKTLMSILN